MKFPVSLSVKTALGAVAIVACASAASAQQMTFRQVRVDVSGLPSGATVIRADIGACLSRMMPQAFAGRINPSAINAPVLVVRPTSIDLTPQQSGSWGLGSGRFSTDNTSSMDSMSGEAVVGGRRIPLTVNAVPPSGAAAYTEHVARIRTQSLCQNFAYWLAKQI
jgi:hypothetical protein